MADYLNEVIAYAANSNSSAAEIEAFTRGLLGDPLGPYNDAKAGRSKLGEKGDSIRKRFQIVLERIEAVQAQEIRVRSKLSQRYSREFPRLGGSHAN